MSELWSTRDVVRSLVEREVRVRYNQAVLGLAWAVLAPLTLMIVFTLFINRVAEVDTGGAPYPLFSYVGLLAWTFFSSACSQGGNSLVQNVALLNKVYCPREVFPLASVLTASFDLLCASGVFLVLLVIFQVMPAVTSLWILVLLPILLFTALTAALVLSVVTVYLRDVRHALPLLLQLGLFATPVIYPLSAFPAAWQPLYVGLNPVAAVIDGARRSVLQGLPPDALLTSIAAATSTVGLVAAYYCFKRLEGGVADVA